MTDRELMQQALDVLEKLNKDGWILADFEDEVYASIEALRARLAQPEQDDGYCQACEGNHCTAKNGCIALDNPRAQPEPEPVAWMHPDGRIWTFGRGFDKSTFTIPLYTAPPQRGWQGLTDEEIDETAWPYFIGNIMPSVKLIVRQLEAKLKEKNNACHK